MPCRAVAEIVYSLSIDMAWIAFLNELKLRVFGMAHPNGGKGNTFPTKYSFEEALAGIGDGVLHFKSTTGDDATAKAGFYDGGGLTIYFKGHGNVCSACWGFRRNCSGSNIGQVVEPLATDLENLCF